MGDGPESPGLSASPLSAPPLTEPSKKPLSGLKLGREETVVVQLPGRNALKVGKTRPAPLADVMKRNPKEKAQLSKLKEAQPAGRTEEPGTPGAGRLEAIIAPLNVVPVLQQLEDAKTHGRHGAGEGASRHYGEASEVWTCGQNSYGELAHLDTVTRKTLRRLVHQIQSIGAL